MTGPYLLRCVLLVRSWWDSAIMWFNLWPVYSHMCLYDGTWCQLHHEEVASSANSYPKCHYDIYPGHIEYLRHTVFIGNRFLWLYINFCLPPWFWCIIKESANFLWWVSRGGEEGSCMFLQIGGMKNERGGLIHLSALWGTNSQKFAHSSHLEKIPPLTWENPPVSRLSPPVLPNTKFFFNQASKPKPLNWYRYNSTVTELSLRGFGARSQQSGKSAN